ncbi:MAG TPA: transposase [Caulobacteraceae bacterium]|jgi:hypothetical protein|nr:transposase [Caulobacteraceae bacterium]
MARDSLVLLEDGYAGVEALLGGAAALDALAVSTGALRRRRTLKSGSQLLRLALKYATSGGLRTTAAWAGTALGLDLSNVAVFKRLRDADGFLEAVVRPLLERCSDAEGAFSGWDGPPIRLVDGSIFAGPKGRGQVRLHGAWDPVAGRFATMELTSTVEGEGFTRVDVEPGSIMVGDRVYARTPELRAVAEEGAFFLVRAGVTSMKLARPDGLEPFKVKDILEAMGQADSLDVDLLALDARPRRRAPDPPLPIRLVALRATPAQAEREQQRIQRSRTKQGVTPRDDTRSITHLVLLATNLDRDSWPPERLGALMRLRWQIELAFKTLKTTCQMRQPPMNDPRLLRSWVLANLAAVLLAQIIADDLGDFPPSATTILAQS